MEFLNKGYVHLETPTGLNVLKINRNYILTTTANMKHTNLFHAFLSRVRFHEFHYSIYFGIYFDRTFYCGIDFRLSERLECRIGLDLFWIYFQQINFQINLTYI